MFMKEHLTSVQGLHPGKRVGCLELLSPLPSSPRYHCFLKLFFLTSGLSIIQPVASPQWSSLWTSMTPLITLHKNGFEKQEDDVVRSWESGCLLMEPPHHHLRSPTSLLREAWLAPNRSSLPSWCARWSSPWRAPRWAQLPEWPQPMPHRAEEPPRWAQPPHRIKCVFWKMKGLFLCPNSLKRKIKCWTPWGGGGRQTSVFQDSSYWLYSQRGERADGIENASSKGNT